MQAVGVFGCLCVYVSVSVYVHVVYSDFLHPSECFCARQRQPENVTVVEMHSKCIAASHILMTPSFYWTSN